MARFIVPPTINPPTLLYLAQVALLRLKASPVRDFDLEKQLEAAINRQKEQK